MITEKTIDSLKELHEIIEVSEICKKICNDLKMSI